jgi:hypothetical protein
MSTSFLNICKIKKQIRDCKNKKGSISMGFQDNMKGYNEIYNAIEEAKKSNVFVRKTC